MAVRDSLADSHIGDDVGDIEALAGQAKAD